MKCRIGMASSSIMALTMSAAHAQTPQDLAGCWNLRSVVVDRAGEKSEPFGPNPIGQMWFSADGNMSSIQIRPDAPQGASTEPTKNIVSSYLAYFGTYELKGKDVIIRIAGATRSDWRNTTTTRTIESVSPDLIWAASPEKDLNVRLTARRCAAAAP